MEQRVSEVDNYEPTPADHYRENAEGRKLIYDMLKHITTLSTATALLMVTVSDKLLPHPLPQPTLLVLTITFVLIAAVAFLGMFFWATSRYRVSKKFAYWATGTTAASVMGYLAALLYSVLVIMSTK